MCLFLCQYCNVLVTVTLYSILKSGIVIPPALLFLPRIALAIWCLLCFHQMNFQIDFYISEVFMDIFYQSPTVML
jgi:hypothetical protein